MSHPVYKRIVLKLSGEALQGKATHGIDQGVLISISRQIKEIRDLKVDVAIVLGAGNIFRGQENTASRGLDKGHVIVDPKTQQTSLPGIWAAGDVADGLYAQIGPAIGEGIVALLNIYDYLNKKI